MNLADTRFAGMAMGVGTARILGRVHSAKMDIPGGHQLMCSFTVLEDNKVDLLFGLDNLKRHQCCIDLVANQLHFNGGSFSVPFLGEGEIKKNAFEAEKESLIERQKSMGGSGGASPSLAGASDAIVKEIQEMGFSDDQGYSVSKIKEALMLTDNNKEHAIQYLMDNQN